MQGQSRQESGEQRDAFRVSAPSIELPKGGGAIRGIGEKFSANPVTGTGSLSVPVALSPGRGGFGPELSLNYDSGAGNGPFGYGWQLALPAITRKTDKGLPVYDDSAESDVFLLSGAEDLVRSLVETSSGWVRQPPREETLDTGRHQVFAYRPRTEGLFATIERWARVDGGDTFWRTISRDNVTTYYGRRDDARVRDPAEPARIFSWLISETHDDRGNVVRYEYRRENRDGVDVGQAHERNRTAATVEAGTYLKRISYGNTPSRLSPDYANGVQWHFEAVFDYGEGHYDEAPPDARGRVFSTASPQAPAGARWPVRADPFSSHRAGFEVRSYRLCRRVLMFHRFPALGADPVLVKSTEFSYRETPAATFLDSVRHAGFVAFAGRGLYKRTLPPLSFDYSRPPSADEVLRLPVETVSGDSVENLPAGLGASHQWVDLHGDGVSGVLGEREGAWYFKRNLGEGRFGPVETVPGYPSVAARGTHRLMDLAGDGQLDVVVAEPAFSGFIERTSDEGWAQFRPFESAPTVAWQDPNVRFIDLTGDGLADLVISEQEAFVWHRALGEAGFASAQRVAKRLDEEKGPQLVFSDGTQSVFLADMCGDGLTDLVRIRNGEISYWPNLGYGRFGARISMDRAPLFDHPDRFDPARVRLADLDGSGTTDIVYLHPDAPRMYFNRSGNSWSEGRPILQFPRVDDLSDVQVIDLLGRGTACLVWSSPLPGDAARPLRYIDLMAGVKPNLLVEVDNNLGATTTLEYRSSTHFYLADRAAGKPWITRLPFPVHVVTRVTVEDRWRQTKFSSTYSYHHGYFDGEEREFRGFGRVDQVDVETYGEFVSGNAASPYVTDDRTLYQPPVKTVTWHHTGAAEDRSRIFAAFEREYFSLPGFAEHRLPQPALPTNLAADEWREAARACKGMTLRQEVFELDVDALDEGREVPVRLFSTAFHNCVIRRLQPRGDNRHAVFLVTESEALTHHYEHDLRHAGATPDPRIAHTLNLRIDDYGNVLEAVAAAYPRIGVYTDSRLSAAQLALVRQVQNGELHLALNRTRYTDDVLGNDVRRLRVPCQMQTWEVTGVGPAAGRYFTLEALRAANLSGGGTTAIPYHQTPDRTTPQRRLVECRRTLFFADNLSGHRDFGECGPLALPYESYKLALTEDLLQRVFTGTGQLPAALAALDEQANGWPVGGYRRGDTLFTDNPVSTAPLDQQYWISSGVAGLEPDAAEHFFLPERYTDPFGNVTRLEFDPLDLFVRSSTDALLNTSVVERFDYRVLAPLELLDANGNRTEVVFDALGMVVATATKGKQTSNGWEGDNLGGFDEALINPPTADVVAFCTANAQDDVRARDWLGNASARFVYHFGERTDVTGKIVWNDRMAGACGIVRERHAGQLAANETSSLQVALECSDGSGNVLMKKVQAEPDPDTGQSRWIVNGLTVLNNKGKPVKQYEPAFSAKFGCEPPQANGVTTVTYYDAAGRAVRTEMPDGTFSRVEFSPWHVKTFDANDTVFEPQCSWYRQNGRNRFNPADTLPIPMPGATAPTPDERAGWLSARHANTPAQVHLDSLGREVIAIAHNRVEDATGQHTYDGRQWKDEFYLTFTRLDAEGKPLWIRDARGNLVMQYITPPKPTRWAEQPNESVPAGSVPCYDIAGNLLHQHSMDAGDRWMLMDAAGQPMLAWDANDTRDDATGQTRLEQRVFRTRYDRLHRPVAQSLAINGGAPVLIEAFEYCDTSAPNGAANLADARRRNLIGQAVRHWDPSGRATVERVGFNGTVEAITRTLVANVKSLVVDWNVSDRDVLLDRDQQTQTLETFHQQTEYDALRRMTRLYNWHRGDGSRVAIYEPEYNERGALRKERLAVRAIKTAAGANRANARNATVIEEIAYNAKGQKILLRLGNGTSTRYSYDPQTFRLRSLTTDRGAAVAGEQRLQELGYTYDPVGNITHMRDAAQPTVYSSNAAIRPEHHYVYDALYRLIEGTGRENPNAPPSHPEGTWPRGPVPTADVPHNYTQRYIYDPVGNFVEMRHLPGQGSGWTRHYTVQADSNRLDRTWYNSDTAGAVTYRHDPHGNMLNLDRTAPGQDMRWDWRDMIRALDLGGGGDAFYNYGIDKQRTRKRIVRNVAAGGTITEDRIYLGGYELYRRRDPQGDVVEEIDSLHLFEGEQRVLLVDDVIISQPPRPDSLPVREQTLWRYQYGNHLGSVGLELDDVARVISYEEFHPYGTSAYRVLNSAIEAPPKRYRYTGMERDEGSGLRYHAARQYLPALGRWTSCDPKGVKAFIDVYVYCALNPVVLLDQSGLQQSWSRSMPTSKEIAQGRSIPEEHEEWGTLPSSIRARLKDAGPGVFAFPGTVRTPRGDFAADFVVVKRSSGDIHGFQAWPSEKDLANFTGGDPEIAKKHYEVRRAKERDILRYMELGLSIDDASAWHRADAEAILKGMVEKFGEVFAGGSPLQPVHPAASGSSLRSEIQTGKFATNAAEKVVGLLSDDVLRKMPKEIADVLRAEKLLFKDKSTVAVLQGIVDGKIVTLVTTTSEKTTQGLRELQKRGLLDKSLEIVDSTRILGQSDKTGKFVKRFGSDSVEMFVHAEQVLAVEASKRGLEQSRVATSINACKEVCTSMFGPGGDLYPEIIHLNPQGYR